MTSKTKVYVLDTSVLLFDANSINNFEDNNIALPITVLEELDNFKIGNDSKNFEAREVIRFIDHLSEKYTLRRWISLGEGKGKFKILMHDYQNEDTVMKIYGSNKNDHKILNATMELSKKEKNHQVILITKDINLRIKAKALGIDAQDYLTGKVNDFKKITENFVQEVSMHSDEIKEMFRKKSLTLPEDMEITPNPNQYLILKNGTSSCLSFYNPLSQELDLVEKNYVYGIKPKNAEQTFALHAMMNPDIKLVALQGVAGTGKTLLALAAGLAQNKLYNQIIFARPIVPLSNKDIGFLPGAAEDKIGPYMEPIWDNLNVIKNQFKATEKKYKQIMEMQEEGKLSITALAFIRGRSLSDSFMIIDEAQNLTPHEVKTIITRAGEGTKIIFTGDIYQIDTPYLDEKSNGLTYMIDRLRKNELFAYVKLEKGERSELANLANELL